MPRIFKKRKGGPGRGKKNAVNIGLSSVDIINNRRSDVEVIDSVNESSNVDHVVDVNKAISVSRKKIYKKEDNSVNMVKDVNNVNCVLNISLLSSALNVFLKCKYCDSESSVQCYEDVSKRVGLASKLVIICTVCRNEHDFFSSRKSDNSFETNVRFVYGLRSIGKGQTAGKILCGMMNLPSPPSRFQSYFKKLNTAVQVCSEKSMKDAVQEAVDINDGITDLTVALDGTWQKRGHTSLNGVVSATNIETGKVIDHEILTKYCQRCRNLSDNEEKLREHKESGLCHSNYSGVSGGMESAGAVAIFERSLPVHGVRYVKYLGDGDSKGFKTVLDRKPYGEVGIEKLECVGHVQKRMGARLRRLRREYKGKKLEDGRFLSGKGRLSDKEIDSIQNYYGMAIRNNTDSLENMRRAVWAIFHHRISTDDEPQHFLCPKGISSWCKYNRSQVTGEFYSHKHPLPASVGEVIKPIFSSLAHRDLLQKCLHGKTQNPNESFNNVIWNRIPKTVFVGYDAFRLGVNDAVLGFNEGNMGRVKVLDQLGIDPGVNALRIFKHLDTLRVNKADFFEDMCKNNARRDKGSRKRAREEEEDIEDPEYGTGMH